MEWFTGLFTGSPFDAGRVAWWGLIVMAVGILDLVTARRTAEKLAKEENRESAMIGLKLGGLVLVMIGALITMRIIG